MLLFKKQFLTAIRQGSKTQTVRLWKHCRMKRGQRSYIPGVGYIYVQAVDAVQLADLTDTDALADGFPTADRLRQEIAALYPEALAAGCQAYRVRFRLCTAAETAQALSDKAARGPRKRAKRAPARDSRPPTR